MAVYSNLLLSTGGGVVSRDQQAEQVKNTASILIGLGGTGVHCIRTIKTRVYERLKPDNKQKDEDVSENIMQRYEHIRFFGVDTTDSSKGGALVEDKSKLSNDSSDILSLSDSEFFSISNSQVANTFKEAKTSLKGDSALSWLEYDKINVTNLTKAGAGGKRQVGRYMLMVKALEFVNRIKQEINSAKRGLDDPTVNVHVFSGLSGGTGSGCFLDVCYLLKQIGGLNVYGYFFLPDVNLDNIPVSDNNKSGSIIKNGYAAMQELDYCMNLQHNGGSFEQEYKDVGIVTWDSAPVNMCHLICATYGAGANNVLPNAYDYAMNVTAEYIMDFLTDSDTELGLEDQLSNFLDKVDEGDTTKSIGANIAYCVIGAACVTVPFREINTYLASELFECFSVITDKIPTQGNVEDLVIDMTSGGARSLEEVYEWLYDELFSGTNDIYVSYPNDWKYVLGNRGGRLNNSDFVLHYTDQTSNKIGQMETNAQSMLTTSNTESLLSRLCKQLDIIVKDIDRGPMYAYRMLAAAENNNLLNQIDGLLAINAKRFVSEIEQDNLRIGDVKQAESDFQARKRRNLIDSDKKRFADYEEFLMFLEQHKLLISSYEKMDDILNGFKQQVLDLSVSYYVKLNRVMETLINTFRDNRMALQNPTLLSKKNETFFKPMVSINEIKNALDEKIAEINVKGVFEHLMNAMLADKDQWIGEDANKISRFITTFLLDYPLHDFANRSITDYLRDKYNKKTGEYVLDGALSEKIYNEWLSPLVNKQSRPLFPFNETIWKEANSSPIAYLSFPNISAPIQNAAEEIRKNNALFQLKASALRDRIYVMRCNMALPLSSYNNCREYEEAYFSSRTPGRHYYESKPVPGVKFSDWRKLPSITPQSQIDIENVKSIDWQTMLRNTRELYDKANSFGLIDNENYICVPDMNFIEKMNAQCDICEDMIKQLDKASIAFIEDKISELTAMQIPVARTEVHFPVEGSRDKPDVIEKIRKDRFVAAPAVHADVAESVKLIEDVLARIEKIKKEAENKIKHIGKSEDNLDIFCNALFVGVFDIEGFNVVYEKNAGGFVDKIVLSKRTIGADNEFPFSAIPLYQAYLTYQKFDQNLCLEVNNIITEKYSANLADIMQIGEKLKQGAFSDDYIQRMIQLAQTMDNTQEIKDFLIKIKQEFKKFCLANGL